MQDILLNLKISEKTVNTVLAEFLKKKGFAEELLLIHLKEEKIFLTIRNKLLHRLLPGNRITAGLKLSSFTVKERTAEALFKSSFKMLNLLISILGKIFSKTDMVSFCEKEGLLHFKMKLPENLPLISDFSLFFHEQYLEISVSATADALTVEKMIDGLMRKKDCNSQGKAV